MWDIYYLHLSVKEDSTKIHADKNLYYNKCYMRTKLQNNNQTILDVRSYLEGVICPWTLSSGLTGFQTCQTHLH